MHLNVNPNLYAFVSSAEHIRRYILKNADNQTLPVLSDLHLYFLSMGIRTVQKNLPLCFTEGQSYTFGGE